jgi:CubicO group peptidase (beta-lactamase class C family)
MKKRAFKLIRIIGLVFLFIVLIGNLFILLTGRHYLYSAISKTYLRGESGPGIYDLDLFAKTTINTNSDHFNWNNHPRKNTYNWKISELDYHKNWETTAFLVIHKDSILLEKYWGDHNEKTVSNSFSAAKTIIALLIGIAIDEGYIKNMDEPVGNYIPEFKNLGRQKVTIRHLLQMASGLDWEESGSNPVSEAAEGYFTSDLHALVTRQLVVNEPGKKFKYQSGNSQLLGIIITNATKMSLSNYMETRLWKKIGASSTAYWSTDQENGIEKSFCCFYATARDYALLGRLLLNKGKWGNKQLISSNFMKELITTPTLQMDEGTPNQRYGLHTWVYFNQGNPVYYFRGYRGQYILTVPKDELIIVRLGMKREKDFNLPEKKISNAKFLNQEQEKIGHSPDVFNYIINGYSIFNALK